MPAGPGRRGAHPAPAGPVQESATTRSPAPLRWHEARLNAVLPARRSPFRRRNRLTLDQGAFELGDRVLSVELLHAMEELLDCPAAHCTVGQDERRQGRKEVPGDFLIVEADDGDVIPGSTVRALSGLRSSQWPSCRSGRRSRSGGRQGRAVPRCRGIPHWPTSRPR